MQKFEFSFLLCLWCEILSNFRNTSQALQAETLNLSTCSSLFFSLLKSVSLYRDQFNEMEDKAKIILPDCDYKAAKSRKIKRNDGAVEEIILTLRDSFCIKTYNVIVDKLVSSSSFYVSSVGD